MSAITVSATGALVADPSTVERLKALCAEDAAILQGLGDGADDGAGVDVLRVASAPGDAEVEALLGSLMTTVYVEAQKAFRLARTEARPGGNVYIYEACSSQAARLCRAFAELTVALDRRRGKGHHQKIVVQHLYSGSQAVGMVNR
jgi:hypothetical protein